MYILKKLIRLLYVAMMIKEYGLLTKLHLSLWIQRKADKRDLLEHLKYKMINFDEYTNENEIEHNSKWPYIPDDPYRMLAVGGFGSGKTNALFNSIGNQPDIDKIYLYAKDPFETRYQYLSNKREEVGLNHYDDPKAFMEYSNDTQDVYKTIEDYNPRKNRKVLIVFDDMIADMINNKKLNLNCFSEVENLIFLLSLLPNRILKCHKMLD